MLVNTKSVVIQYGVKIKTQDNIHTCLFKDKNKPGITTNSIFLQDQTITLLNTRHFCRPDLFWGGVGGTDDRWLPKVAKVGYLKVGYLKNYEVKLNIH